jgi:hypothetical protein
MEIQTDSMIACNVCAGRLVVVTCQLRCGDGVFRNDTSAFNDLGSPTLDHFHVEMQQKHRKRLRRRSFTPHR